MIKAVLFDLDDTLLDLNLTAFVGRYLHGLSGLVGLIADRPAVLLLPALAQAFLAADAQERDDLLTNDQLFCKVFRDRTGIPLDDPQIAPAIRAWEREVVPSYLDGIVAARPRRGMRAAVERAHELDLTCALASNPVFSLEVDLVRMRRAGVNEKDFAGITTIHNSRRSKPSATYYLDFIASLGLCPEECLMVGNDARRDFSRPGIGLRTLYVGHALPRRAFWRGRPERLAPELESIVAMANALDASR